MTNRNHEAASAGTWLLLGTLGALVLLNVPELGSDPWTFRARADGDAGILDPLVRIADREWDLGILRAAALLAGLLVAIAAATFRPLSRPAAVALAAAVAALLLVPAVLLQVGLRRAAEPWTYTNDSTYQIELAGDLILDGDDPYGFDYRRTPLERWYTAIEEESDLGAAALDHLAYFPGTPITAAGWRLLPAPIDDYRVFVLLATLGLGAAALLFPGPLELRLAAGAALAASPAAVRGAWFGTADAPSLMLVVASFGLAARGHARSAAATLAGAVLLKQFALVAVPFVAVMLLARAPARRALLRAAAVFGVVVAAGFLPFLIADAGAVWDDTIAYGADTYRIIGYGLAGILVELGAVERTGSYPFALVALLVWLPVTVWLLLCQWRSRDLWPGAAGFAASMFVLLYVSRVLQNSYLVWPLAGLVVAALLAAGADRLAVRRPRGSSA